MTDRRVDRFGDSALLVRASGVDEVLGLAAELGARPVDGQLELVPGAAALLVILDGRSRPQCRHRGPAIPQRR